MSTFPWSWLRENCYSTETLDENAHSMTTTALASSDTIPCTDYTRMMNEDEGLLELLNQVVDSGFAVVSNTPSEPREVMKIAERIAPVSHTFLYGDVFDVVAEQNPVN